MLEEVVKLPLALVWLRPYSPLLPIHWLDVDENSRENECHPPTFIPGHAKSVHAYGLGRILPRPQVDTHNRHAAFAAAFWPPRFVINFLPSFIHEPTVSLSLSIQLI